MLVSKSLSWRGFWIAFTLLFGLLFVLNYNIYVMPDAASVTVGLMLGAYLFAYFIWWVTKFSMKERAPEYKFFVTVLASFSVAYQAFNALSKLFT